MSDARFGQVLTAMVTPFADDGSFDEGAARKLAAHLIEHGSDGLVLAGTTGESPTLSHEEKLSLFEAIVDEVGGRARRRWVPRRNALLLETSAERSACTLHCDRRRVVGASADLRHPGAHRA